MLLLFLWHQGEGTGQTITDIFSDSFCFCSIRRNALINITFWSPLSTTFNATLIRASLLTHLLKDKPSLYLATILIGVQSQSFRVGINAELILLTILITTFKGYWPSVPPLYSSSIYQSEPSIRHLVFAHCYR